MKNSTKHFKYVIKGIICLVLCAILVSYPGYVKGTADYGNFAETKVYAKSSTTLSAPKVTITVDKSGNNVLKWKSIKNAKGYIVYRKLDDSKDWKKLKSLSKCKYTDKSEAIKNAKTVAYKVYAYTKSGKKTVKSKASNEVTVEIKENLSEDKIKRDEYAKALLKSYKQLYPDQKVKVDAYEKFVIVNIGNVYIEEQVPGIISNIMDTIENVTHMSFFPADKGWDLYKIVVQPRKFIKGEGAFVESAYSDGMSMYEDFGILGTLNPDFTTIVHEMLHVIQLRNYADVGNILTEGFAESYTDTVCMKLREKFGYEYKDNAELENELACIECYGINELGITDEWNLDWLNKDNVEEYFFLNPAHSGHEPSYWIVEYIREKYGEEELYKLFADGTEKYLKMKEKDQSIYCLDNESMLSIIKKNLSKKFVQEFYKWFTATYKKCAAEVTYGDFIDKDTVKVGYAIVACYDGLPILNFPTFFKFKNSLTMDFTDAAEYMNKHIGLKWKGIVGDFYYSGKVEFFDKKGKLIYTEENPMGLINVEGSVKCTFSPLDPSESDIEQSVSMFAVENEVMWYDDGVEEYLKTREYVRPASEY